MPMIYNEDTGQYEFVSDGVYNGPASQGNSAPNVDPQTLRAMGYVQDFGLGDWQNTSGADGRRFNNALEYYQYLYGPGVTQTDVNGETVYKTPNGADAYLPGTSQLTYNPPPSMGSQLTLGAIAAMAGAGLLGGTGGAAAEGVAGSLGGGSSLLPELGAQVGSGALAEGLGGSVVNSFFPAAAEFGAGAGAGLGAGASLLPELGAQTGLGAISEGLGGSVVNPYFPAATELAGAAPVSGGLTASQIASAAGSAAQAAGSGGASTTAAPAGSAISRILDGTATTADWTSILGNLGATGLGLMGANSQSNALQDVYNQQMSLGSPYRDRLNASYQPGFNLATADPAYQGALDTSANAIARATSTKANTFDPGAQMEMQKYLTNSTALPALQNYRSQLGTFGQLGTNTAGAAAIGGAQSQGGTYNALGYGLGQLTQPDNPFKGLLSNFGKSNSLFSF